MFQTIVDIPHASFSVYPTDQILTLGSCFAENIGEKLQNAYFNVDVNPFGVLYNPLSIKNSIDRLVSGRNFTEEELFESRGLWNSFSHSSLFSATDAEKCLEQVNYRFIKASGLIRRTNVLLLTFGTAWVYEKDGEVVANCHKLPASTFDRRRLSVEEIVDIYNCLVYSLMDKNPELQIILTVSPIRHWKDGAAANTISKSTLILAAGELENQFDNVHYFPAYEIMMDELRDYRFYASDMIHPSEVAIDYIWQRFSDTFFNKETKQFVQDTEQLTADLAHRPLFPESEDYRKFVQNTEKRKAGLLKKYPFLEI